MRKCGQILLLLTMICLLAAGCGKDEKDKDVRIYYVNSEKTGLVYEGYDWKSSKTEEQIGEMLEKLRTPEDSVSCSPAIPSDVVITDWRLKEKDLEISFSREYELLGKPEEILLRAAIVKTLDQIEGIEFIRFYVNGEVLKDGHGNSLSHMRAEDFAENTGAALNSYQRTDVTLYYSDVSGRNLVKSEISLRYNSYMTLEKAIVERLIKGPSEEGMRAVLPPETKLLGVSIKDNICYVNLDEGILAETSSLDPEVPVYALVNSIIEGGNCSQVQLSVNGETDILLYGAIDLSKPLTKNIEIVEE